MIFSKLLTATSATYSQTGVTSPFFGIASSDSYAGYSVDVSENGVLVVGAPGNSGPTGFGGYAILRRDSGGGDYAFDTGSSYSYVPTNGNRWGYSVSINSAGTKAIITAPYNSTAPYTYNGISYLYSYSGSWSFTDSTISPSPQTNAYFGWSADISGDGSTIISGAWQHDDTSTTNNGTAFIYSNNFSTYQAQLLASDKANNDYFGYSVSISNDGNTALVGAYGKSTSPYTEDGAAYVFTRSGGVWTQQAKLLASDRNNSRWFGRTVSLSSDGNTAFVVASLHEAVYVFTRAGTIWTEIQKITEPFSTSNFGLNIANGQNGKVLGVSSYGFGDAGKVDVYLYNSGTSTWVYSQSIGSNAPQTSAYLGTGLAINEIGGIIAAGAPGWNASISAVDIGQVVLFG
jgi:hypothetical protein